MGKPLYKFLFTNNWVSNNEKSDYKLNLAGNHESIDELTKFDKMLITLDRGLLELNGVHFWRLCFFEV